MLALTGLSGLACGLPFEDLTVDPDSTGAGRVETIVAEPGPSVHASRTPAEPLTALAPPCQTQGWPCTQAEVPDAALAAQDAIDTLIETRLGEGVGLEAIADEVEARPEVMGAQASPGVIVYRVDGGRPMPYFTRWFGASVGIDPGGLQGGWGGVRDGSSRTGSKRLVAFQDDVYERDSLLADAITYEFPYSVTTQYLDKVRKSPGYDEGQAAVRTNPQPPWFDVPVASLLEPFRDWRNFPYVNLHVHGKVATFGDTVFAVYGLVTDFVKQTDCEEWLEGSGAIGVICREIPVGGEEKVVTLIITLDALYALNSAPLEHNVLYSGACDVGQEAPFATKDASAQLLGEKSALLGWTADVSASAADAASLEFTKWTLEKGLRTGDAFDKLETRKSDDATVALRGRDDVRAREVVFFATESGEILTPSGTELLEFEYEEDKGWWTGLTVRIDGVMPNERGAFETVLSSSARGSSSLTPSFEPEVINPSSPDARPVDDEGHLWVVPVELSVGEQKPRVGERIDLDAQTELPEGGVSSAGGLGAIGTRTSKGYGSFVVARADCAFAHIQAKAGPGSGDFNVNLVTTLDIGLGSAFTVSGALAERVGQDTPDEIVNERAPVFSITVTGGLPRAGQTLTYANDDVTLVLNTSDSSGLTTYLTEGARGEKGNVTLQMTGREDGSFRGKLRGIAAYPDPSAEDEYSDSGINIVFLSGPTDDFDETFQCF